MKNSQFFNKVSEILSICIFLISSMVLIGWIFDIPVLKSISPDFVAMKANTAICFILIGLSLWLSQTKRQGNRTARKIARLCACVVFLIGFPSFCEYLFKWDLGIDQLLFKESATAILTSSPGRMAFNTSIIFVITGIVLLLCGFETALFPYLAQVLIIPAGILALLSFVGYLYGASPLYIGLKFSTAMALHTCVLFIMSSIGCLFARPQQGLMKNVSSDSFGGQMLRRILPVVIFVPLVLGGFKIYGEHTKWFGNEFGVSLVATCNLLVLGLCMYILSVYLNRLDTKRKAAEMVLRDSEAKYKMLFSTAIEGILVAEVQKKQFLYCNPAICRMLGYTEEELMHLSVGDIHPKEVLDHAMAEFEATRGGKKFIELPCQRKDGTVFDASISASGITIDGRECLFGFFTDITERKQAEEKLKIAESKVRTYLNNSPICNKILDLDFNLLYMSPAGIKALNIENIEDYIGKPYPFYFYPESFKQRMTHNLEKARTTGKTIEQEAAVVDVDGNELWYHSTIVPINDDKGQMDYIMVVSTETTERRKAADALRQSEEKFRLISQLTPAGIYMTTSSGECLYVNERWCEMAGLSLEEALRMGWIKGIYHEDRQMIMDNWQQMVDSRGHWGKEYRFQDKDGKITWVYGLAIPQMDAAGKILGYIGLNVDITQHKQAEEALRLSEERFRLLFEQAPLGYQSLDEKGCFIEVNQVWLDTLGYSRQEVVGKWFGDFLAPEFVEPFRQRFPIFKAAGKIHSEFQMLHKSGQRRFIALEGRIGLKLDGSFKQAHCILSDITEHRKAREALRQSEERFQFLFENAPEAIFIQSQGRFVYLNFAMVKLLGASKSEELLGGEFMERIAPQYHEAIRQRIQLQQENGKSAPLMEQEYLRLDGSRVPVETTAVAVRFQDSDAHMVFVRDITERRKSQESLRHEQELTSRIMETSPVGITATNRQGEITFANAGAEKIFGLSWEEVTNRTYNSPNWHVTDYDGNPFPEEELPFQRVKTGGKPVYDIQHAIQRPDGQRILLSVNAAPVFSKTGEFDGMVATIEDVTEQRRTKEALKESEIQFRSLFDTMSEGVALHELITDKDSNAVDYRIIDVNPAYMSHTGLNTVQVKNQLASVFYGTGNPPYLDLYAQVAQTGKSMFFETYFEPLKKYFDISVFSPRPGWFATIFTDITQRMQVQQKLRASEEKFMKAFRSSPVVMAITVIREGRFIEVNDCFLTTLGYRREEVIGRTSLELGIFCDAGQRKVLVEAVKDKGYVRNMECMIQDRSGQLHCALFSAEIIEFQDAQYLLTIMNDITDRKKADELLQLHQANMAHLLRLGEVGEMASGLAHEINQPLCAIENYAQACLRLMETKTESACLGDAIKDIRAQAERAGKIVHRIKGLVRKKTPHFESVRVNDIIREAVELINAEALKREIQIHVNVPENLAPVYADIILIEQVVLNLIRNGMDAMDSPEINKKELTIWAQAGLNSTVEVCVSDTGGGISEENMKKIFQSFFTTKPDGLGIGLPLSRTIIESHSGRIWAAANAESGTTFHFTLSTRNSTDET